MHQHAPEPAFGVHKDADSPEEQQIVQSLRQQSRALGSGECQALACAEKRPWLLLVEERKARVVARGRGVRYSIIQVLPLQGYLDGKLTESNCLDVMDKIAGEMKIVHAFVAEPISGGCIFQPAHS